MLAKVGIYITPEDIAAYANLEAQRQAAMKALSRPQPAA